MAPVFWWWAELGGHRVVVVTDAHITVSGVLDGEQLAQLERARRNGTLATADLGTRGFEMRLADIVALALIPERGVITLEMVDGVTSFTIAPSDGAVAAGIFEELRRRHGVGEVRATEVHPGPVVELPPSPWSEAVVRLGAFGVLALMAGLRLGVVVVALGAVALAAAAVAAAMHVRHGRAAAAHRPSHTEVRVRVHCDPPATAPAPLPADAIDFRVVDGDPDPLADLLATEHGAEQGPRHPS